MRTADFGVFVELETGIEGLIHISELSEERVEKTDDVVKVGERVKARIMSIDKDDKKIALSKKNAENARKNKLRNMEVKRRMGPINYYLCFWKRDEERAKLIKKEEKRKALKLQQAAEKEKKKQELLEKREKKRMEKKAKHKKVDKKVKNNSQEREKRREKRRKKKK